jgi:hypothetical protein
VLLLLLLLLLLQRSQSTSTIRSMPWTLHTMSTTARSTRQTSGLATRSGFLTTT